MECTCISNCDENNTPKEQCLATFQKCSEIGFMNFNSEQVAPFFESQRFPPKLNISARYFKLIKKNVEGVLCSNGLKKFFLVQQLLPKISK